MNAHVRKEVASSALARRRVQRNRTLISADIGGVKKKMTGFLAQLNAEQRRYAVNLEDDLPAGDPAYQAR